MKAKPHPKTDTFFFFELLVKGGHFLDDTQACLDSATRIILMRRRESEIDEPKYWAICPAKRSVT